MAKKAEASSSADLLSTLGDFTSKENWDKFFSIRGSDDTFEWYAEWQFLKTPLLSHLSNHTTQTLDKSNSKSPPPPPSALQILVPGCGNSKLSENVYDAGFQNITNIDFSKVVISDMLRRNIRTRPSMKWRVMDMTQMQFKDGIFDAVLDKGGLDALMEPELGPKLGTQYLAEVKRVLRTGGTFVCLTLAESHVLGLLFSKFRFGWKMNLHVVPSKPSNKPTFRTFMVIAEKDKSADSYQIKSSVEQASLDCDKNQSRGLFEALEAENKIRSECSPGSDILYSLEDLKLGAKGDLKKISLGRRFLLTLGEEGGSRFSYKAVILDAKKLADPFIYHCGVFIVPKVRAHEWLFSSEEGQWMVVESSKAARLIMVFLDARHTHASMDEIQRDLSPLVEDLAPGEHDDESKIPFMMASDGVKRRKVVHQVTSDMTGPITVEDVVYENVDGEGSGVTPPKDLTFRRLTFERSVGLVQSEALVTRESPGQTEKRKSNSAKSRKKGNQISSDPESILKVDHHYLASSYHTGIISGFMLAASNLESIASSGRTMKTVIIGLGAGLLPMFIRGCIPCLDIEVVELDPVIVTLARDYFTFTEDNQLKVHVVDGIKFIEDAATAASSSNETNIREKIDILIIDADSSDSSSGMTCPPEDFLEESFLLSVKKSLSEGGLFVINLVARSKAIREMVVSKLKKVFGSLFYLQLEEDVNEVIFALPMDVPLKEENFPEAALQLQKLLKCTNPDRSENIFNTAKKIKCLK
ncbi:methyltransferase-like protein 13 [Papaver somniferum]|uniref:methyltransferase-like protein 13 n=1 Tax=Papaver somniferum TaxID=3469 RepID=UPI000E700F3C|nr:methyltransferase-like protein 13 [Papaver somniferum]